MTRVFGPLLTTLLISSAPVPVFAQSISLSPPTTSTCQFEDRKLCTGLGANLPAQPVVKVPRPPVEPRKGINRRVASRPPAVHRWERVPILGLSPRPPIKGFACFDTVTGRPGIPNLELQVEIASGRVLQTRIICVPDPRLSPPPVPSPGPVPRVVAPAPERIWSEVPLPDPAWGINPGINGLTGLATLLWNPNGDVPVTATVDLGGFTATATARPVRYEWRMWGPDDEPNANPDALVVSNVAGSEAKPAGTYTYETRGDWTVTHTVTWTGTYTFTGPGVNEVIDLGTTTTSSTRPYHVIEVRGTLRG